MDAPQDVKVTGWPPPRSSLLFVAALLATAIAAGLFAVVFRLALVGVVSLVTGARDVVEGMYRLPWGWRLMLPAVGGLVAGLFSMAVAKIPSGRGVGDVMEAVV